MKTLKQNTKTQLLPLNIPIHITRLRPKDIQSLPVIVINNDLYSLANEIPNGLGIAGTATVSINIDIVFGGNEDFSDRLDDAVDDVLTLLADPDYIQANWIDIETISTKYSYIAELEKPLAMCTVTITGSKFKHL